MFLSFIVPVYNAESYLPDCLNSMLHQDLPHSDYEIICVNDGSKDGSLAVLQSYQARFPNIRIIDKENGGVTTARNAGLAAAAGEYIWFVDSDDFIKENVLLQLHSAARSGDYDRLIIGCYIFEDGLTDEEKEQSQRGELPLNGPGCDSIVVRSLFRKSFLDAHGLHFAHPELTHGEDGMFMYEVCLYNPSFCELNEAIYFYRIHSGSAETLDSTSGLLKKLKSYQRIIALLQEYYDSGHQDSGTANTFMTFLWFTMLTVASLPPRESRKARKQLSAMDYFPHQMLPQCTLSHSYMTDRTDLVGKIYDHLYMHLHTRWGFAGMYLIRQLLRLKRKILK